MKIFTLDEANSLIPQVRETLTRIQKLYGRIEGLRDSAKAASAAAEHGGGMESGSEYVKTLYQVGKLTTELGTLGVQLKDYSRGLVDFPYIHEDRVVLLCWQLSEGDEIEWWHDIESGFAGRRPL